MRGLKIRESDGFNAFFQIVQKHAHNGGMVFFLDCGEGRDFEAAGMEGENLRGWLIPTSQSARFEKEWSQGEPSDEWMDFIRWAEWELNSGEVIVSFYDY